MGTQETTLLTAILISSFVIGIIVLFFIVSIIRQQRRNLALSRQNILAEIAGMEKERGRLANDLHDELGPVLSVIKFRIDSVAATNEEDIAQLQKASDHLDGLMEKVRSISFNLMPVALQRMGLAASIQDFLGRMQKAHGLVINFTHQPLPPLPEEKCINLYRIIQEVLHNTVKHAQATQVNLRLEVKGQLLVLTANDNGKGFDYDTAFEAGKGFGLRSMHSRISILNGSMRVESHKGKGTGYQFVVPL